MCGIIGVTGRNDAAEIVVEGLKRLEYRGYDSAGVATVNNGKIERCRAEGKIKNLERVLDENKITGNTAIGHTRWATHGVPSEKNAHPHATERVAVVHNGIIENYLKLRKELESKNYKFVSDTDTEVIPVLITSLLDSGLGKKQAVEKAIASFEGAYAIGVIFADEPDFIIATRHGAPLVVGYGDKVNYIASDALALATETNRICYLEEGDVAEIKKDIVKITDKQGREVERKITISSLSAISIGKENYRHFMQKEIFEQPTVIGDNIHAYYNPVTSEINFPKTDIDYKNISKITLVGCGTSYYAALTATYWLERIAGVEAVAEIASEFRYRKPVLPKNGIAVFLSQSGETADTLAALKYCKLAGQKIVSVLNVVQSSIGRESDLILPIYSGPEIGVASTKAFTTQLVTLAFLALQIALHKKPEDKDKINAATKSLMELPSYISDVFALDKQIEELAADLSNYKNVMYVGRGVSFPIAMEGALKLKEISYIHAEAYASGELKHGPIALIDENFPIIAIAPNDELFEKSASNIREIAARGGKIILIGDKHSISQLKDVCYKYIEMPSLEGDENIKSIISPVIYSIPVQLLAYHTAVHKGTDVDQPRNLAKSVTVE
ncbi:MAG TPA: glutamine--fructose-6-phosphate transaminase (isomerizing) [Alphaproteobacteria bacterium]|nr:glutamine--fructose-6-phosphate transaminase (isomerizing) [Alphaproteobacteria bacterium]